MEEGGAVGIQGTWSHDEEETSENKINKERDNGNISGGDALTGHTRSHPEHGG